MVSADEIASALHASLDGSPPSGVVELAVRAVGFAMAGRGGELMDIPDGPTIPANVLIYIWRLDHVLEPQLTEDMAHSNNVRT